MAWLPDDWDELVRGRNRPNEAPNGARRRSAPGTRRVSTIAAFTTGTLAVSTAAFAATVPATPGSTDSGPQATSLEADSLAGTLGAPDRSSPVASQSPGGLANALAGSDSVFTNLSLTADKTVVAPNDQVVLTVKATDAADGSALAGEQIQIVTVDGPKWHVANVLTTDQQGTATITARLLTTTTITAVFDGSSALRPSVAGAATITVSSAASQRTGSSYLDTPIPTVIPGSSIGDKAVYLASLQKGKPYVYGSTGPYSFDCSGLVQYVFRQLGRYLPRTADEQYWATAHVPQSAKQPGDLIFFGPPGDIYHVGIYAGGGMMWAAPQTGGVVSLRPIYSSSYLVGRVM
jgi:cell wall-associated NlpC family hydrolase